jgi:hypothetical protein
MDRGRQGDRQGAQDRRTHMEAAEDDIEFAVSWPWPCEIEPGITVAVPPGSRRTITCACEVCSMMWMRRAKSARAVCGRWVPT